MRSVLAIDPGNVESAYALIDTTTRRPVEFGKIPNPLLLDRLPNLAHGTVTAIEMVASYGMPVGREVFETCVWIGRYQQQISYRLPQLVYRQPVKLHHCNSARAKDSNIIQALVDRFASGQPNKGKGTKADPGWFYGFAADVWQAYALAVYVADSLPAWASSIPVSVPESPDLGRLVTGADTVTTTAGGLF